MAEHIFISYVACSDDNKLCKVVCNIIHHIIDQIQALLIRQARNQSDHIFLLINGKSQILLELRFVHILLLTPVARIVIAVYFRICRRVIDIVIDAVYNALHIKVTSGKQTFQSFSVLSGLDFICVRITDGRNIIRVNKTAF